MLSFGRWVPRPAATITSPWKEVLELYFEPFMAFFFTEAHREIDWSRPHDFLDKELQRVNPEAALGRRTVDKLVRVQLRAGHEAWVLIHVEVQAQRDRSFPDRMYVYNYRLFDRHQRKVASLAVLADDQPRWKPSSFGYTLLGCEVSLRFPAVKLLDYRKRWAELEASQSPFAVVVMAHLESLRTRRDARGRKAAKLGVVRELYRKGYSRRDIGQLFRFIDWVMRLPAELEQQFRTEVRALEEEKQMPYITSIERMGRADGLKEGRRNGLLDALRVGLEVRFGVQGLATISELQTIEDEAVLIQIQEALVRGLSLEELRAIWQG